MDVVVGSRAPVVGADPDRDAGSAWAAGRARVGVRRSGEDWGMRAVEARRAARTAVVRPRATRSSRQGHGEVARCRGGDVGMVCCPGSMSAQGPIRPLLGALPGRAPLRLLAACVLGENCATHRRWSTYVI